MTTPESDLTADVRAMVKEPGKTYCIKCGKESDWFWCEECGRLD